MASHMKEWSESQPSQPRSMGCSVEDTAAASLRRDNLSSNSAGEEGGGGEGGGDDMAGSREREEA